MTPCARAHVLRVSETLPQVPCDATFQAMPETKTPPEPLFTGRGSETIKRLIETVPDAIVIADAQGSIVLVNTQAATVGHGAD